MGAGRGADAVGVSCPVRMMFSSPLEAGAARCWRGADAAAEARRAAEGRARDAEEALARLGAQLAERPGPR
ncbi:hypothetical protein THSYN_18570 [Candidatus Thiodictyon syntrophicum]|uniref:Uncharacterized protein n=1 Tax=Candidatus Thiodictyon syntrophicum TaxID=1166950 RepID=A0A2K8UAY4_9GAMM|nr:hypothetical protein THSYN_18570 [Candidatus Thiodictyon syntrophicum]